MPTRAPSPPAAPDAPRPAAGARDTLALRAALAASEPLAHLLQRIGDSRARYDAVRELLPAALRDTVRAGPLDDRGWTLLAPHSAAAAKLRQLLPAIDDAVRAAGWPPTPVRIRVQAVPAPMAAPARR